MPATTTQKRGLAPADRAASIVGAATGINALITSAIVTAENHGWDSEQAHAAWEAVEKQGATIHRQSRLLAGKSRGG